MNNCPICGRGPKSCNHKLIHKFFRNIFGPRTRWVPFDYHRQKEDLKIGDQIIIELKNQKWDFIAGLCGMNPKDSPAGTVRRWTVIKKDLIQCGKEKVFMKYLPWNGHNITLTASLLHDDEEYQAFLIKPELNELQKEVQHWENVLQARHE